MNPILIWRIVVAIGALIGVGGAAYGVDQHQERKKEQAENRARLQKLEAELASKEAQLAKLRASLGDKNQQVRTLLAEVTRLRNAASEMRQAA